jgi:tetratricopeptide (TPR) repeat protein
MRSSILHLGFEAAEGRDFASFFRAVDLVGGLAGWDSPTLAKAALVEYDAGRPADAERILKEAMERAPSDPGVLMCYGRYLHDEGEFNLSLDYLKKALAARPNDPWVLGTIGAAYFGLGEMVEARRFYSESIRNYRPGPEMGWMYSCLGHAASRMQDWGEAARAWRKAAALLPEDEEVWYNLGDALLSLGDYRNAIKALRKNLRLGGEQPAWSYYDLARCYQQLGDVRRARTYCGKALEYAPNDEDAIELKKELEQVK